ncbi:MAG: hypothetical protein K8F91_21845 [Candidatus Obscuribacterales bacterium]|nr:hypothetical protein [Candidatus Obscuribacterales bacterium]
MRNAIIAFVVVLSFTCLFGGNSMSRKYVPVGMQEVKVHENTALAAQKMEGMVAEINFVDMPRDYKGAANVTDKKT